MANMELYRVCNCPTPELGATNKVILNPGDKLAQFQHIIVCYKDDAGFVFSVTTSPAIERGRIAFNRPGRKWAGFQTDWEVKGAPYQFDLKSQCLNFITFDTDFSSMTSAQVNTEYDTDSMADQFSKQFYSQAFTVGQYFGFRCKVGEQYSVLELKVKELKAVSIVDDVKSSNVEIGLTTASTIILFERAEGSEIKLIGGKTGSVAAPQLFSQNWDFASMGIGGLSEQFNKIFRRAFATRLLPPQFALAIGEEHVRGILLYGPPGTGKTLIARQIGKMLLAREPKIVNGPEVLNKYVGESEANIRKLFKDAEDEQAKAGINSGLHMIIFDEIDAICKARGNSASSAGVGDNVVNQLLSKIDGVNSLHNVLLVGMTNRRDLIDEALLRPGRLEVQIEVGLPNRHGRLEILKIHTEKMRERGIFDNSVNLEELADLTKNYTGAELAGLIKAARSLAVNRVIKADSKIEVNQEMLDTIKVSRNDFQYAMEHDIKPALGASEDQVKMLAKPMIRWDHQISKIQSEITGTIKLLRLPEAKEDRPYYVLLVGDSGSGLTTVAANMAAESGFPFIRIYQARSTAAKAESAKVQYMEKLFEDAARSEQSCIVMDDLEIILSYVHIGPRFSEVSRALFITNRNHALPKNHRMLVICTCEDEQFLSDLRLHKVFRTIIRIPSLIDARQVETVLTQALENGDETFSRNQIMEIVSELNITPFKMGIKRLEELMKDAVKYDPEQRVGSFLEQMRALKNIDF